MTRFDPERKNNRISAYIIYCAILDAKERRAIHEFLLDGQPEPKEKGDE